jgi:hypothetical protein
VTATASGLVTGGALAAAVATLGPVLHTRLFVAVPGARQTIGVRGHGQPGGLEAGSREGASRPARPGPRSRRRVAVRLGGAALVLTAGFLLKRFAVGWILRHGLSDSGLAVEAALGAVLAALAIAAWVRHRRPAARHAAAHMNEARMNERPFTEEAGHAVTQHLADPHEDLNVVGRSDYRKDRDELMENLVTPFLSPGLAKPGPGILDRLRKAQAARAGGNDAAAQSEKHQTSPAPSPVRDE